MPNIKTIHSLAAVVMLAASATPVRAQIANIAVTSAVDYSLGVPNLGGIGAIFCTGLAITGVQPATTIPLPLTLSGVQVKVGGVPAPLYAVASLGSYQQINFQVPANAYVGFFAGATVAVTVSQSSQSATASIPILYGPGQLFALPVAAPINPPAGIFQHDIDYSLITASNPARSGENITVYGAGFFDLFPLPADGTPASANPLTESVSVDMPGFGILDTFTILIDGTVEVTPQFMGLTPGAVGLGQINFAVPPLKPGAHQVQIKQDHRLIDPFDLPDAIYLGKPVVLYTE